MQLQLFLNVSQCIALHMHSMKRHEKRAAFCAFTFIVPDATDHLREAHDPKSYFGRTKAHISIPRIRAMLSPEHDIYQHLSTLGKGFEPDVP